MNEQYINCFGVNIGIYGKYENRKEPYQFEKTGDNIYIRFENNDENCAIVKINKNGNIYTQTWAYGAWADRATLTYIPINEYRTLQ